MGSFSREVGFVEVAKEVTGEVEFVEVAKEVVVELFVCWVL